jgi:ABC-type sugar transport system ATPase subunit
MSAAAANVAAESAGVVLEARDIRKTFGGTHALKGVSVAFHAGEVHAIVGENGAGKSTLVKILTGVYHRAEYSGSLALAGDPVAVEGIRHAESLGIFLVPQDLQIVPDLSVAENLFLNREPTRLGVIRQGEMLPRAADLLRQFRLPIDPSTRMGGLAPAQQQLVVIARAMMRGVRILALDEPTAALTDAETRVLFEHVEELRKQGIAIIYISHRLDEITRISDRITVLRDGNVADLLERGEAQETARRIVRAMVGRDVDLNRRSETEIGGVRLAVQNLSVDGPDGRRRVCDFGIEVRSGEVVGVFGSVGSGSDDFAHALLGMSGGRREGAILIDGAPVAINGPADAIRAGVGYLPGDRQRNAMFPLLSVAHNIGMLALDRNSRVVIVDPAREIPHVHDFYERFRIKARSMDIAISTLSGGNQQKAMLARVLSRDPAVLILHEPTQGVDIATKQEVYGVIDRLAHAGKAILLVSSDLEEVLIASDRIIAFRQGRAAGAWERAAATQHVVLAAATGGA